MKIGFIDYFIDEWHANNYPRWIDEQSKGQDSVGLVWASWNKPGRRTTAEWCADFGVQEAGSIEEVLAGSDAVIVLSPDNAEQHPALCARPLKSGKPVYVDKTFATDAKMARGFFAEAAAHKTPLCSMSALRYADEILARPADFADRAAVVSLAVRGPGKLADYGVHQLEIVSKLMGTGACRVRWQDHTLEIDFGGRSASITFVESDDFAFEAVNRAGKLWEVPACTNHFPNFIAATLKFFHTGVPAVPAEETIEIMAMIEKGLEAQKTPGEWIAL